VGGCWAASRPSEQPNRQLTTRNPAGTITTLEGVLSEAREQLGGTQEARLARDGPEVAAQVDAFLARLDAALAGTLVPLTIRLDDPAGNSFIDNPSAPRPDPRLTYEWYARSAEQIAALGLQPEDVSAESTRHVKAGSSLKAMLDARATATVDVKQEMLHLPADCPECRAAGEADTCIVNLPFFKEVIIMSFNCERCGFRDTEIKVGCWCWD
jgi:zinc finger protein